LGGASNGRLVRCVFWGRLRREILLFEVEARLRRLADSQAAVSTFLLSPGSSARTEELAKFLPEHFLGEWTVGRWDHAARLPRVA
jgi:hypothetical protein